MDTEVSRHNGNINTRKLGIGVPSDDAQRIE
jgi:hypothetical protein